MVWALSQMAGGTSTIVEESGPLQLADAADFLHFVTLCLIRKWWPEQHCALVRPADLDVRQLKYHLRFEGCYSAKE